MQHIDLTNKTIFITGVAGFIGANPDAGLREGLRKFAEWYKIFIRYELGF